MHSPDGRPWLAETALEAFELAAQGYRRDDALAAFADYPTRNVDPTSVDVFTDWTRRSGPFRPVDDSGREFVVVKAATSKTPYQNTRGLACDLATEPGAVYLNLNLSKKVRRIGCRFGFGPGDPTTGLTLVTWVDGSLNDGQGNYARESAHCHFVLTPTRWIYNVVQVGAQDEVPIIAAADLSTPLAQDYTEYDVEITIDGNTATILLPDRTTTTVTSPLIGSIVGIDPGWEWFQLYTGSAPLELYQTWASVRPVPAGVASLTQVAQTAQATAGAVAGIPAGVPPIGGSNQQIVIPAAVTPIAGTTFSVRTGPTGTLWADVEVTAVLSVADTYVLQVLNAANQPIGGQIVVNGTTWNGRISRRLPCTGLTPNTVYQIKLGHWAVAGGNPGNVIQLDTSTGKFVMVTAFGT
jgi:hypothetical protein